MNTVIAKSALLCLGVLFLALAITNVGQAVDMTNVVSVWPLDEGSGETVSDASGNVADGTFVDFDGDGISLQWVDGVFGGALAFDGTDDWVEIPGVIVDTVDWSMGCWANPGEEQNTWTNIMSSHVDFKGVSFETFDATGNLIGVAMGNGETWGGGDFLEIEFNEWNHMVYTRSGDHAIWYLNGEIDSETTLDSDKPVVATTENFRLGNWILGGKGRVWNGLLDEAFIFERALSQDEIRDIMNNGVLGTGTAVNPADKTSVTWGQIKSQY